MRLIKHSKLRYNQGSSDKVYEIDLCDVGDGYVVNFRYGRFGGPLREGTKTDTPVSLDRAEALFASILVSKTNKGYAEVERSGDSPPAALATAQSLDAADVGADTGPRISALLATLSSRSNRTSPRIDRIIWRLGELRASEAANTIIPLLGSSGALRDYCVAWSLSRLTGPEIIPALQNIAARCPHEMVRRIARVGLAAAGDAEVISTAKASLPTTVQALLQNAPTADSVADLLPKCRTDNDWLDDLYLAAQSDEILHQWVCALSREMPLKAGYFVRLRHWFKAAECIADGSVFGELCRRFQTEGAAFWISDWGGNVYLDGRLFKPEKELRKPNSKLAFSNRTRGYLQKRGWRHMRRVSDHGGEDYVQLATGVLLALKPGDGGEIRRVKQTRWQQIDRRWEQVTLSTTVYPEFAGNPQFNQILYRNSVRLQPIESGRAWCWDGDERAATQREEAFPQLWDQQPDALLTLLKHARVEPVHDFALRAIKANRGYCEAISTSDLLLLLSSDFSITQQFALQLARKRWNPAEPDAALLKALLKSALPEARSQACSWLNESRAGLRDDLSLTALLITSIHEDVQSYATDWLKQNSYSIDQGQQLLARVFSELMSLRSDSGASEPEEGRDEFAWIQRSGDIFLNGLADSVAELDVLVLQDLLAHPLVENQALAGRLLAANKLSADQMPPDILEGLLRSDSAAVRASGVALFGRLPDETLKQQLDLLVRFVTSEDTEVRAAARTVVGRLASAERQVAVDLLQRLIPVFFRAERAEGIHDDLLSLARNELSPALNSVDINTVWRLVHAKSKAAQKLGGELLLTGVRYDQVSVRQLAGFFDSAELRVRQWAQQGYEQQADRMRANADDALRGLNSRWTESRQWLFDWLRREFHDVTWSPDLLIAVCDNPKPDVQQFGGEMLTRFFIEAQGADYLLKLSQHPSQNVQLFATNYLERYAAGQPERIEALKPYFVTVLAQVNRSRVAKARILKFLAEQAPLSERAAKVAADVLSRQSVTVAIGDKAGCMQVLADIAKRYPQLDTALKTKPIPMRATRAQSPLQQEANQRGI